MSVGFNNVKVVERTGTRYDGYGQLDGYRERSLDTAQPDVTVDTERKGTEYDRMGRERGRKACATKWAKAETRARTVE
jgi:hypothetical protein